MELKTNFKTLGLLILFCSAAFASVIFSQESIAPMAWRSFSLQLPEEVNAQPGQTITIDGGILNTGWWWMHDFTLMVTGLTEDYKYSFSPQYFETVQTLKEWNSDIGVYRVPEKFTLTITVPENAAGLQLVTVTGQEMQSAKQVSNSTQFVLKISAAEHFTLSDITFPENATEGVPFDVKATVTNDGVKSGTATLKVSTPEDWTVAEKSKSVTLDPTNSSEVVFTITPTITIGNVTLTAEYPYKENITTVTKVGPMLVPIPKPTATAATTAATTAETTAEATTAETTAETTAATTAASTAMPIVNVSQGVLSSYLAKLSAEVMGLPLWVIVVAAILMLVILWNMYSIFRKYKFKLIRGKVEELEKVSVQPCDGSESF